MELVAAIYSIVRLLPVEERFALGSQLRRSATSIAANVAEGHSRTHRKEFLHFLSIAHGSLAELQTLLSVAERVGLAAAAEVALARSLGDEVSRMLTVMRARLGDPRLAHARRSTLDASPPD
jgi:four helix bundle protein